jgi:CubicO group peptidase (beta-lactamase class C family)
MLAVAMGMSIAHIARAAEMAEPATSLLFWSQEQRDNQFKNIEKLMPARKINKSSNPYPLGEKLQDLSDITYELEGKTYRMADYMERFNTVGLLVLKNEKIVFEQYRNGNDQESRWISFSVTKSVSSMLIGAAIKDGFIKSVNDPVTDYLPRLKNSSYDQATIKNVLNMASGVAWNEDYADPDSDVSRAAGFNAMELFDYLNKQPIAAKPGEKFNYNTGETNLVGAIVRAAVGNNQSAYLEHKIWQPFGMADDAYWSLDARYRAELGGCCINATLRDYARIGVFAKNDGVLPDGTRVLPEGYLAESTEPSKGYKGYGYLWWLQEDESFAALIWINPKDDIVIAMQSSWPTAVGQELQAHRMALVAAIEKYLNQ